MTSPEAKKSKRIFIIAEAGVNHNGSLKLAKELIDAASEAGADAVKFQTFKAEELASRTAPKARYQKITTNVRESQLAMLKRLEISAEMHQEIIRHCRKKGICFLSSIFDLPSLEFLIEKFKLDLIKIPSGEITNGPLLLKVAELGIPIILSTGMSTLREIENALGVLAFGYSGYRGRISLASFRKAFRSHSGRIHLRRKVTLLHCTTDYPAPFTDVNLRAMATLSEKFGLRVGYSDHTTGITVSIAAAALGATVVEKHFTLNRSLPGPDHKASLEPDDLKAMVTAIRQVEQALGSKQKKPTRTEIECRDIVRKSLVAAQDIHKGEYFSEVNLTSKRPGSGLSPMRYWNLLGRRAKKNYKAGILI